MPSINYLAVIAAGVLSMVTGFIWYGPLFSKAWMKEIGKTAEEIGDGPGIGYLITFVSALVRAFVVAILVSLMNTSGIQNGLLLGLGIWVGFVFTTFLTNYIFAGKSYKLLAIDSGYFLVDLLLASTLITLWR
jgi:hypothetical protein